MRSQGFAKKQRTMTGLKRITRPMARIDGELQEVTWEEALSRTAQAFDAARAAGPNAFGIFSCSKATNEVNFAAGKFARQVMRTNNIDSCNRT